MPRKYESDSSTKNIYFQGTKYVVFCPIAATTRP